MSNAKSRWKILAKAITSTDLELKAKNELGLVRFPSYQLVLARPLPVGSNQDSMEWVQRDWFLISSPHFPTLKLKVRLKLKPSIKKYFIWIRWISGRAFKA